MTQTTENALLEPTDPGGLAPALRAALACRIARLNDASELADHYQARAIDIDPNIAKPAHSAFDDARLEALVRHVDRVTHTPKDATREDITRLRHAGVDDADIVRLSQLIAFVNYQLRVIAGLRALEQTL